MGLDLQEVGRLFGVHHQVRHHVPLGIQERGIASLARRQVGGVIGQHGVQEALPVPPLDADQAPVRQINEPKTVPQRPVFGLRVAVVQGKLPVVKGREAGLQFVMDIQQRACWHVEVPLASRSRNVGWGLPQPLYPSAFTASMRGSCIGRYVP